MNNKPNKKQRKIIMARGAIIRDFNEFCNAIPIELDSIKEAYVRRKIFAFQGRNKVATLYILVPKFASICLHNLDKIINHITKDEYTSIRSTIISRSAILTNKIGNEFTNIFGINETIHSRVNKDGGLTKKFFGGLF